MKRNYPLDPAYGRQYATPAEALKDWSEGKDFRIASGPDEGRYCSKRDEALIRADGFSHASLSLRAGWPHVVHVALEVVK